MNRVLISLAPVFLSAVYFFGWRVAAVVLTTAVTGFFTEWFMQRRKGSDKVSMACFVTTTLLALSLPPSIPLWIAAVGSVVGIFFAKEAFGGFGKNPFNPAVVGRAFIFVSFPIEMTSRFSPTYSGFPGGFTSWLPNGGIDAMSAATPLFSFRNLGISTELFPLFTGAINTGAAGSMGEVSAFVILLSALYLFITGTAKWQISLSTVAGASIFTFLLHNVIGIESVLPVPHMLFSGAMLYITVFMVTDPVSAPKQPLSQILYGFFIGAMIILFRYKAAFVGGAAFAVLFGNMVGPSIDLWITRYKSSKSTVPGAGKA